MPSSKAAAEAEQRATAVELVHIFVVFSKIKQFFFHFSIVVDFQLARLAAAKRVRQLLCDDIDMLEKTLAGLRDAARREVKKKFFSSLRLYNIDFA